MKMIIISLVVLSCLWCSMANAEERKSVLIQSGFITGNDFLTLNEYAKRKYIIGYVDGLFASPFLGAPESQLKTFKECVEDMVDTQLVAILIKYLGERPEEWRELMSAIAYRSLVIETCGLKP